MILALALAAVSPLVGAWQVVRLDARVVSSGRETTNEVVNAADRATGIVIYDASGWSALEIGAGDRTPDRLGATGRRRPIETGSYYAWYGRYEIDLGRHVIRHLITDSLMSPEIGITAVEHYALEGDDLTLTSEPIRRPEGLVVERIFLRRLSGGAHPNSTGQQ